MKVLHFYKTYFPDTFGGIEQVINQIARGSIKLGIEVDVLSLSPEKNLTKSIEIDGHVAHRERQDFKLSSTAFSVSAVMRFLQLAKKADVIHYHFPWPFMDVVHFATRVNKPTVITYHSDIIRQKNLLKLYRPLMIKLLENVDRIVATSPNYYASSEILKSFSNKVTIIPIGLDKASYPIPSADRIKYWQNRIGGQFFLFVGLLRYYKGLHFLINASKELDYPVLILGAGPEEKKLKMQASMLGLRNLHFLGRLSEEDKVALLSLSYAVVLPSHLRSEAFGISLLEGAMYGKPMISCEISTGTTFINIEDQTGLVVPPEDSMALRNAMRFLWEHPKEASEMGRRAEERYWKHFTAEQMVKSYVQLYRELVNQ